MKSKGQDIKFHINYDNFVKEIDIYTCVCVYMIHVYMIVNGNIPVIVLRK